MKVKSEPKKRRLINFAPALESRPYAPITQPEIPRCAMVVPMPERWMDELNKNHLDPGQMVASLFCNLSVSYNTPGRVSYRNDFPRIWGELKNTALPGGSEWASVLIPIRADVWQCVETAASWVKRPVHEVFLKVLARQLKVYAEARRGAPVERIAPARSRGITSAPIEKPAVENTLIFHKCRHCPHGFKPWDAPRNAS